MSHSSEKRPIPENKTNPVRVAEGSAGEIKNHRDDIFFAAIETTRMPMLVTDPRQEDNPIVFVNRAFCVMSGYAVDEIIGRNCRFLQGQHTQPASVTAIREAVQARREVSLEILNYRKDGSSFWNALFISPVYNQRGELVYFFASQLDVSRRRDAEDALSQAQKMEALGQLTGGIAHDFNNLLQVMSGHLDLTMLRSRRQTLGPQELEQSLDKIRGTVQRAATLTQQLLAFARKQKLRGRAINLNALATDMASLAQRTLGEQINIRYDLEEDLPNCELDPTQAEVALLNVLVNARDAMPQGGVIRIRTQRLELGEADDGQVPGLGPGRYVSIAVSDSGTGMTPEIMARVMEPFFTTKEEGKGTGLGLSMVYGFAKQSGGTVTLHSELGAGTTVRLYFRAAADAAPLAERAAPRASDRGGDESILIVEDRDDLSDIAREMLEGLGYRVYTAKDGTAAIALVESLAPEERPDLLFSDIVMPGISGYALADRLKLQSPGLRVLLTTGFDRETGGAHDNAEARHFDILMKPYRMSDLARRVRIALDGVTGNRT